MNLNLAEIFCQMHLNVRDATEKFKNELKRTYYVTPTNYLELVLGYLRLLASKQKEVGDNANKLRNGLGKLEDARK
jgi:dynein heavy chain